MSDPSPRPALTRDDLAAHPPTPFEAGVDAAVQLAASDLIRDALANFGIAPCPHVVTAAAVAGSVTVVATVRELQRRGLLPDFVEHPGHGS